MSIENAVAVVGMACRLPGADHLDRFWENLRAGRDTISRFTSDELRAAGVAPESFHHPDYVAARGVLPGGENFDWPFFGYSPREAATIDPQQRVFLECAATALDDAGIDPRRFGGWIGVVAGCELAGGRIDETDDLLTQVIGLDKDFLATRAAYKLGLRGPALTVQTACSTSLVAVHEAVNKLLGYECDAALAGGVSLWLPQAVGYTYSEGHILSADGRCRPFDASGGGTVPGAGVGVVVLRRLEDALADRDRVLAVIRGSAINNDGADKPGYTTPSIVGQRDVIRLALANADVDPADIGYVEAHGTGTRVGDPVEVSALTAAFREGTDRVGDCWLGAVKGNVGHTGAAAGVTGLIKTVLQIRHRELVPTPHFKQPNPEMRLESTPFRISVDHREWTAKGPLLAGVSSFGIGGTNAHVVVESAPEPDRRPAQPRPRIFPLSAAATAALERMRTELADRIEHAADPPRLDDAAFTLAAGRRLHPHRLAVVAGDHAGLGAALRNEDGGAVAEGGPRVVFAFPGQATLHPGAGAAAYRLLPAFRAAFDEVAGLLDGRFGVDPRRLLAAGDPDSVRDTGFQQLAQFALGYSLGQQLRSWGIRPAAMIGNSIGEYVAVALSGAWELPDALGVVHARGQAMRETGPGRMLSVAERDATSLDLPDGVHVAVDAPHQVVLSGPPDLIESVRDELVRGDVTARLLETDRAFHSPMMEPAAAALRAAIAAAGTRPAEIPVVSNLTGTWLRDEQIADPRYWSDHLLGTVRLTDGIGAVLDGGCEAVVELGPGQSTLRAVRRHPAWTDRTLALPALGRSAEEEEESLLRLAAKLWQAGADIDLAAFLADEGPSRCALPAHPFEPLRVECRTGGPRAAIAAEPAGSFEALGTGRPPLVSDAWGEVTGTLDASAYALDSDLGRELELPGVPPEGAADAAALAARVPDRLDGEGLAALDALADRARRDGAALLLAGRDLVDVLGTETLRPGADRLHAWLAHRHSTGGVIALLDLGHGDLPARLPGLSAGVTRYAWRGSRWWGLLPRPVPVPAPGGEGTDGPDRPRVVLSTDGGPDDTRFAADLAAAGASIVDFTGVQAPPGPGPERVDGVATWRPPESRMAVRRDLRDGLDAYAGGLIGRFVLEQLRPDPGALTAEEFHRRIDPAGRLPRFVDFFRRTLVQERVLLADNGTYRIAADANAIVTGALEARDRLGEIAGGCRLLAYIADALPAVFRGEREPVGVLWPDGDETLLLEHLADCHVEIYDSGTCLDALRTTIRALHAERGGRPMRVLEVGAGHGAFTWPLLDDWDDRAGLDYHFTDISTLLVRRAAARARDRGMAGMRFSTFDITRDPAEQGLAPGSFDLVVAYNVVHVAPSVRAALAGLRRLLAPGGMVSLVEVTEVDRWSHLLWGLAPGWWDYDDDLRSDSIHLPAPAWARVLRESGLPRVRTLPADAHPDVQANHSLIFAAPEEEPEVRLPRLPEPGEEGATLLFAVRDTTAEGIGAAAARWNGLRAELPEQHRAVLLSVNGEDAAAEAARAALDPPAGGTRAPWHHLRVPRLGPDEIAALPRVLGLSGSPGLPGTVRLENAAALLPPPRGSEPGPEPGAKADAAVSDRSPVTADDDALAALWCEELGVASARAGDDFFALGGESLAAVHLLAQIRRGLGVTVAMAEFAGKPTYGHLAELVRGQGGLNGQDRRNGELPAPSRESTLSADTRRVNLMTLRDSGPGDPLFFAGPAAGSSLCYRNLAAQLDDRPFYGLESPGLHDGGWMPGRLEDIAARHVELVRHVRPHGPYLLGGWSFGAMVAHEMSRQLAAAGERVELLLAVDGFLPDTRGRPVAARPSWLLRSVGFQIQARLGIGGPRRAIELGGAPRDGGRVHRIGEVSREHRSRDNGADAALVPDYTGVHNRSITAMLRYTPRPAPCPAVVFKAGADARLCARLRAHLTPLYPDGGVEVVPVPGDHWTVLDQRHAGALAERVRAALATYGSDPRSDVSDSRTE
ncbi:type I polyketide synthase [Spirillospora sp. CA-255316]